MSLAKKKTKKKVSRRVPAEPTVNALSTRELQAELARRERQLGGLARKRDRLREQLEAVEQEIRDLGGDSDTAVRRRPRNEMNLVEALQVVLKGRELGVTEAADAVLSETGYQTSAANFRTIVNQTLLREKAFKKVSRGVYTAA